MNTSFLEMNNFLRVSRSALLTVLVLITLALQGVMGQTVASYSFSQSSGTYTAITGGTQIANQTALTGASAIDDVIYNGTIPFTFTYDGSGYTAFKISSNGFITFGSTAPATALYTPISSTTAYKGAISAFGIDLLGGFGFKANRTMSSTSVTAVSSIQGLANGQTFNAGGFTGSPTISSLAASSFTSSVGATAAATAAQFDAFTGEIRVETTGTSPNRICVIQWKGSRTYHATVGNRNNITLNFQIRLFENNNKIDIVYGNCSSSNTAVFNPQVGLRGTANTDYNSRTMTASNSAWLNAANQSASTASTGSMRYNSGSVPASGTTFTWTPPACPSAPTGLTSSLVTVATATISWTAASPAPANGYHFFVNTTGVAPIPSTTPTGTTAAGVVTANLTGLAGNTQHYYWVRSNCNGTDFGTWVGSGTFTTPCAAEAAPTVSQPFTTFTGSAPNPLCWGESSTTFSGTVSANTTNSEWLNSTGFANAGTNVGVKTNLFGTDSDDWIISQPIDLGVTAGLYRLSYRMAVTTYNATLSVASLGTHSVRVVISTNGGNTWALANVLRTYTGAATYSSTGVTETIDLTTYSGVVKIAFVATTSSTSPDIDFHIDDFVVEAIPSCINPSTLTSSSINYTSATINWVAPSGSPVGYEYEVRSSNAAGSGATGLEASGTTTSAVTANITGLTDATAYTYYVRTNCGGTYSSWSSSTFTTLSCNVPTGVGSSAVATTTATISWTAPAVGSPTGYQWEVRSSNAAGSGATGLAGSGSTTSPTVTANVTVLSASTAYSVYVRTNCAVGLNSAWTTAATFTTACAAITALPHTEAFGSYLPSTCWQEGDLGDLTAGPTTISATASSWEVDGFLNNTASGSAKLNIYNGSDSDWIISPQFTLPASPAYRLKYSVGATQWDATTALTTAWEADDFVEVLISTTGNTNWTILRTYNSGNVPSHLGQIDISDLTAYAGQTFRIAFRGVEGNSNGGADIDFFIDNFIIEEVPNCVEPTAPAVSSILATSANVSWTAPSGAPSNGYFYAVTTSATPPANGSGTAAVGTGPISVSLSASTTYYLHVQGYCGGTDYSAWATSSAFTTPCAAISSFPWSENFDALGTVGTTSFPTCWFKENGGWATGNAASSSYTDPNSPSNYLFIPWSQTNSYIWTPGFQLTAGQTYDFSFAHVTDGYSGWTNTTVYYNTAKTSVGATALGAAITSPVYTAYTTVSRPFMPPTTGIYYFAIRVNANSNPFSMGFDDFSLTQLANCSGAPSAGTPPVGTNVCSGGTTTLTVTGATTGSGISYQWEEWNGSAWVSAVGGSGAATTSYTTPALTVGKQYRFTVLCTPSSQSASTTGITITVGTPANDACATAQAITVGAAAITGSVACAAAGSGGCGGTSDYDVWYSFTVGSTADYKISLLPSASFDGVFQLYNGCGGSLVTSPSNSVLSTTSCIDGPFEGGLEFANYNLTSGTYYIRVYDYNGSGTAYPSTTTFTLEVVIPVSACDAPTNIASCGTNINTVIASGAGDWSGYYDCTTLFYDLLGKESVFTYTPAVTSSAYTLTVNSLSPSGTVNYINFLYKASTCSAVGVWNCIDERNGTGTTLPFSMTAGVTYYFLLKPELTTGYTINWRIDCPPAPPVNDACANATPLPCGTTNLAGTTVASVSETVSIGCTMSPFGVWYSFVGNGFSTTVSSTATFDHEMGIASGSCGALVNIACRDAAASGSAETHTFTTAVGITYYVYIGHWSSASTITGTFTISRTCTVNEWTGNALNTDWATNGNWSTGTAPTSAGTAYIPTSPTGANFPTIDEAAQIATLTLATGATLNIQTGNSMTVTGVLTNNGTISVANGGSLVQGTGSTLAGSGTFNVSRNGSSVYDFWSSPITSVSPSFLSGTVYGYNPASGTADPSDDAFDPGWVGAGGSMVAGKGYAAYGAGTKTFTGTANNGDITIGVTSHASPNVSYNLIGNPYPSGVNVSTFLSTNSARLAVGSVYLWDDPGTTPYVTGDYAVRNALSGTAGGGGNAPTGVLGTAQGFKVNVNGNGTIQFTNAMRAASNTANIFRQSETQLLWLNAISADNRFNQTLVGFAEDGTDGNDWGYDAPKLNALGELSLYSYMDGEPLAIQGYGPFEQERIVPLGLNSDYQTVVTISLDSTENMDVEDIILEDRYYGLFHDLRVSSYVFQSAPMLYGDRFFLHFAPQMVTGIISNTVAPEVQSYIANDMLNLRSNSRITGILQMFDMSGKMVLETSNVTLGTELLSMDVSHLAKGVYSVRIQDSKKAHVQKVIK